MLQCGQLFLGLMCREINKAYERALLFLEKRDRTEKEVSDKLFSLGFSEEAVLDSIKRLENAGLINDEAYAGRYLDVLMAKGRGRLRIALEMRRKGLSDELVRNTLDDGLSDEDERVHALEAARRAQAAVAEGIDSRKALAKVNRKLISLGFAYSTIGDVMEQLRHGCADDEEDGEV